MDRRSMINDIFKRANFDSIILISKNAESCLVVSSMSHVCLDF